MGVAGNNVTINRGSTDTIGGPAATTATLSVAGSGIQLVADTDKSPDNWGELDFGTIANGAVTKAKLATGATFETLTAAKTGTYVIASADDLIPVDGTSGGFTVTLPAASSNSGKRVTIKRIDSTLANAIVLARAGSDTIDGATSVHLMTQYESWTLVSDGSATWHVEHHKTTTPWTAYTPTYTGFGTVSANSSFWRRVGDTLEVSANLTTGTVPASLASASLPSGLNVDTAKMAINNASNANGPMVGYYAGNTLNNTGQVVTATATDATLVYFGATAGSNSLTPQNGTSVMNNSEPMSFTVTAPISNWEA